MVNIKDTINDSVEVKQLMLNEFLNEIELAVDIMIESAKKGNKILEIPYTHPIDIDGNSKSFPNISRFLYLGFFYIIRLFQTIFRR